VPQSSPRFSTGSSSESRAARLLFSLKTKEKTSTSDLLGLVQCVDEFTRALVEGEALDLLTELELPQTLRLETLRRLSQGARPTPTPGELVRVERGSWNVEVLLPTAALVFILKQYIHPTVQQAWNESRLRERLVEFMREKAFGGARRKLEEKAIQAPRHGTVEVVAVEERASPSQSETVLEVRLEQRNIMAVRSSDPQLIDEFLRKLRGEEPFDR